MTDPVFEIDDSNFQSAVLESEKPVLVDFWAPWCGPCKAIGPIVAELAETFSNEVSFTKCNVDANPMTPGTYGIKAIPALLFFKGGKVVDQITGMVPKVRIEETLQKMVTGEDVPPFFPMQ